MAENPIAPYPERKANTSRAGLGAATSSDIEALRADLEQAGELAQRFHRDLLGKSSELASLKEVFEKAHKRLIHLQLHVTQLRDERHQLANRAMEADALEQKLNVVTADRDRLRAQLESSRKWQG
ncbi:MAG: hypothetical protein JWQ44_1615 [Chthoniobacter sp.]|jgi:predicted RNase H-like nuclease (RuvC/YqgF family)|nr:hypothetical protein [Chthoniobacter sp.]